MPTFFKANSFMKGSLTSLGFSSADGGNLFISTIKQSNWDDNLKRGEFRGEKCTLKMSLQEIGQLLNVLNRNVEYKTVHRSKDAMTSIFFNPYYKDYENKKDQVGFGLRIMKKSNDGKEATFSVGFSYAEAEILREYFSYVCRQTFFVETTESKKAYKYKQSKQDSAPKPKELAVSQDDTDEIS